MKSAIPHLKALVDNTTLIRFLRFGLVGGTGIVVDMSVLFLLNDPRSLAWGLSLSKALAAETAIMNNFVWNDIWTFKDLSTKQPGIVPLLCRLLKFNLICLIGIALSVALLNIGVHVVGLNVYLANFAAIMIVSVWNFWMNLKFGWTERATARSQTVPVSPAPKVRRGISN